MDHIGEPVDLVIVATPMETVPSIIAGCSRIGAAGAVIISAGGKETGRMGRQVEKKIHEEAVRAGLRIIGPNCLGIMCSAARLNASFAARMPLDGRLAFVSQSGAICTAILDFSVKKRIGFSHFISLESMLDVNFGDVIDYLGADPKVGSIVMYVESLSHHRQFMSAVRAVSRVKPIIALKAGRTRAGASAAASHTGAMAGEDMVYDAAFQRAGIVRVKTFEELFDAADSEKMLGPPASSCSITRRMRNLPSWWETHGTAGESARICSPPALISQGSADFGPSKDLVVSSGISDTLDLVAK
jgi:acetyltransferase